ncbi:MAG TPA: FtsX-like permease family protein [Gemmataceae bacterium]|nr:FtsX-like permease family protein [Gemmataceae bacterium]
MRTLLEIARTGVAAALLHPARSLVTVAAVLAVLLPYLVGLGISTGVRNAANAAVSHGADLYVSGEQLGRPVPIPRTVATEIASIPGVERVVPRIVGRIELGKERVSAVVVGVPVEQFPAGVECIEGRLYASGPRNELVVGTDLARKLNLKVGSYLPPFYHSRQGERVSEVVGIFRSDVSPWQARLIVTSFETAAHIFDQPGLATDLLVYCRPGYEGEVRQAILRTTADRQPRLRVVAREDAAALIPEGLRQREGVFTLLFTVAFAVAILVVLVTSGFGLAERRREVGILKATGWQTDELLLRSLVESLLLAVMAWAAAVVLAVVWLKAFNGYWIAGVFLAGVDREPGFRVPFRLTPVPVLLAGLVAVVVVAAGSLYSTWRSATAPPREAMR